MRDLSVEGLYDVAKSHGMQAALWSPLAFQRISIWNLIFQNSTHQEWSHIIDLKELDASFSELIYLFFLAS